MLFRSAIHLLDGNYSHIHIIPVWINTSLAVAIERNNTRTGLEHVPDVEIEKMYKRRRHPRFDEFKYTAIMEVNE